MADPSNEPTPMPEQGRTPDPQAPESEQILGAAAQVQTERERIEPKWRRFYDALIARRDAWIDSETDLGSKAREINPDPIQKEQAEVATEEFQRDQLLGMRSFEQESLDEINAAISRIENGTYGICEATGKPIPEERLEAIPWARFTLEAQRELEARGQTTTAGIGPLGNVHDRGTAPPGPWRDHEGST